MNASEEKKKIVLTPLEMVALFGFPPEMRERLVRAAPSSSQDVPVSEGPAPPERYVSEAKKDRNNLMASLSNIKNKINKIEDRKTVLMGELRSITRAIDLEKTEKSNVEPERPYPIRGVFTVGLLIFAMGLLILWPFPLPPLLQFLFGSGLLLIGLSVLLTSLFRVRKRPVLSERRDSDGS